MEQYSVTGMSCAACAARVEKAVKAVPGVQSCAVSLLTNSMGVEGTADSAAVVAAVTKAGYGASPKNTQGSGAQSAPRNLAPDPADPLADTETPKLKKRLFWSLGFLLLLMYVSMGHMMWGFPLPEWFEGNHVAMGLIQLLLAGIVMVINQRFFISGFKALLHRAPNMDTLVSLGSAASFGWSVWVLFAMTRAQTDGDMAAVEAYMMEFYFESAAMILTLITVGKLLEARSKGRTTDALKGLMKLAPQTATVLRDGAELTVPVAGVQKDELFIVRPGESVPVDGVVVEGSSAVNESALTGESIPVDKAPGDALSAATVNQSGWLKARATRVGEDTTLNQIIKMVSDAAATKAPIAKTADKVSGIFVPVVLGIAVIVTAIWLLVGQNFSYALGRGISVLVISCPCALGLATPVAIMVGSGVGAKNGILFKTAVSLEQTGKVKLVALDKTGTVTTGRPAVTELLPAAGVSEEELLSAALALESRSEHPLARAIVEYAQAVTDAGKAFPLGGRWHGEAVTDEGSSRQAAPLDQPNSASNAPHPSPAATPSPQGEGFGEVTEFRALPGNGLEAVLDGKPLIGGSVKFITERLRAVGSDAHIAPVIASGNDAAAARRQEASGDASLQAQAELLANQGKTPLLFAHGDHLLGLIAVADTLKPESPEAIRDLQNMGLKVIMLTGDNERTAKAIAAQAGVDEVVAGVLPEGKEAVIRELQQRGPVLMVGDGINDAPALTRADVGMAIGAGTDVAIDAADVVLMKSRLSDVPAALRLSRATLRNIRENLFWAFIYNTVGIPLAAGAFVKAFGWTLNPMFGAAAMSLSSFCVVSNALRLNLVKLGNRQQAAGSREQATGNGEQATGSREQATGNRPACRGGSYPEGEPPAPPQAEDEPPAGVGVPDGPKKPPLLAGEGDRPQGRWRGSPDDAAASSEVIQISVKGMMCHNCERHVKEALEALPGVESAEANFETGLVAVRGAAAEKELKAAIRAAGYKFRKIVK